MSGIEALRGALGVLADPWKLVGLAGMVLFAGRWIVQAVSSRRAQRSVITPLFWLMSVTGSFLLCIYFAASPNRDPVGLGSNLLPLAVALYNLLLLGDKQLDPGGRRGLIDEVKG